MPEEATVNSKPTTIAELAALVERGLEAILPEGVTKPADGVQPCGECQGVGTVMRSYTPDPQTCYSCWWGDRTSKAGTGVSNPPSLEAILHGLYKTRGGLAPRRSYLSPADVEAKAGNRETGEVYTYIRAHLEFDLGRGGGNIGGLVMNELRDSNPWKGWADHVGYVLLALHGRTRSEGAARWAQALGVGR
jgi:hypothetical protein